MSSALPPSIFSDVIGPVMRGPSSSHCAASLRIGRIALDLAGGKLEEVLVEFDVNGSLATTHDSQGSDMGLCGGFLGFEADDERLPLATQLVKSAGIDVTFSITDIGATHPNTYKITLRNGSSRHAMTAISVGGGMIEVVDIDGFRVSLAGDYFVTLIRMKERTEECVDLIRRHEDSHVLQMHTLQEDTLIEFGGHDFVSDETIAALEDVTTLHDVHRLHPVLPVLSRRDLSVPFQNAEEMLATGGERQPLSEFALDYECARSGLNRNAVVAKMAEINRILRASIDLGLKGTSYDDRILGFQSGRFAQLLQAGKLLDGGMLNRMILYVTALMEVKSSMGVIVAAPTAGSCAACPGACLAATEVLGASEEAAARAMLSAGLIGVFTAIRSSFAAEVGGCQAETGAGAAMAAAALVELAGGDTQQSLSAASLAFQNVLGLVCDPVANRVEAPCLGRNVVGAANALSSANMALAGFDALIPLDQVLDAHREISRSMPRELRCTALGGLSITPASRAIEVRLRGSCGGCQAR